VSKKSLPPLTVDSIFSSGCTYEIPIYQRNFAWEEIHISQLIEDIHDNEEGYFLGNLIVHEKEKNIFTIIDGQQRLTTLFIIYKALIALSKLPEKAIDMKLEFQHRADSKELLQGLGTKDYGDDEKWSKKILEGYDIVKDDNLAHLKEPDLKEFIKKLKEARMLRISVPEGTDRNHYFEIMNTRGEQLEKVDILKSRLMEPLPKPSRKRFADIWDACSNMNEYVVKSLRSKNQGIYEQFFDEYRRVIEWKGRKKPVESQQASPNDKDPVKSLTMLLREYELQKTKKRTSGADSQEDNQSDGHYESLVQFPEFLLHVLNIMSGKPDDQLDKENLLDRFKEEKVAPNDFIVNLLKYRFFYDTYIGRMKARLEETDDDKNDKEDIFGIRQAKRKRSVIYSVDTFKSNKGDNIRALQWALRITHTAQKSMQWITEALQFVDGAQNDDNFEEKYLEHLENGIKKKVIKAIQEFDTTENFTVESLTVESEIMNAGLSTPHVIFAYLDYVLQKGVPVNSDDYYYDFRTSVEHLYPQNENEVPHGQKIENKKLKENFGNLFLINRKTNSRFSNINPDAKWKRMAEGMPPKLWEAKGKGKDPKWTDKEILKHCEKMIGVLQQSLKEV